METPCELEAIRQYWNTRSEGHSLKTQHDLQHSEAVWLSRLRSLIPCSSKLNILDLGCGSGFFSVLLARLGHTVTAFDYAEDMLKQAYSNALEAGFSIRIQQGDAQNLPFQDSSYDMVVSRNLTWNLEYPEQAYSEWLRVLKPQGVLINFDGNHYRYLYDDLYAEEEREASVEDEHKPEFMLGIDPTTINEIARRLPLSKVDRPEWDMKTLLKLGIDTISIEVERKYLKSHKNNMSIIKNFIISARKINIDI